LKVEKEENVAIDIEDEEKEEQKGD